MQTNLYDSKMIVKQHKAEFYQAKYEYYQKMVYYIVLAASVASFFYWFTDCMLYGRVAYETLIPRASIFLFLAVYQFIYCKSKRYNICIISAYIMIHLIVFCTCWAVYNLENRTHAGEGLMVIECIFIFLGMAAPKRYSFIFHFMILLDIIIANIFIHYTDFATILVLHIILIIAAEAVVAYLEKVFADRFTANRMLTHIAIHDQLTNVYNRSAIKTFCNPDSKILNIDNAGILMIDIDFFKRINDAYGHETGDEVLKMVVNSINSNIRANDYLIRYGGEEFLVILSNVNKQILLDTAARINTAVKEDLKDYKVTVSIGGTMYDGTDYHNSVTIADKQLYYIKTHGRNSIKIV